MKTRSEKNLQQSRTRPASLVSKSRSRNTAVNNPLQRGVDDSAAMRRQRASIDKSFGHPLQREQEAAAPNQTGMPDNLKQGIESLSGLDMSGLRVHYGSAKPAQLNAHAYAQGSDIHLGPGQEQHLPHEAWHVVQQQQGRVQPTTEMGGEKINDDATLEHEADVMGARALNKKIKNQDK